MNDFGRKAAVRSSVVFCVLVTAVAFAAPLLGGRPASPGLGFILWGAAPLLVSFVMRTVARDWADLGIRPAIRNNAGYYLITILAWPAMLAITLLVGGTLSASSVSGFSVMPYLATFLPAFAMFLVFAIFEEFGWRGYLVPKLASTGINPYLAYIVVGIVWATWHLPYIRELSWVYSAEDLTAFIPRFYLAMIANSVLYNELRLTSGSVWPAVLLHGLANAIGHPLFAEYVTIAAGKEYLISSTGLFMIVLSALLGIALNRWRTRRAGVTVPAHQSAAPSSR